MGIDRTYHGRRTSSMVAALQKLKAFTLVELLVVIGIIAMLISILLPALSKARAAAMSVNCQANVRSLVAAALTYTHENQGVMPAFDLNDATGPNDWFASLAGYLTTGFNAKDPAFVKNKYQGYLCPANLSIWDSQKYWWDRRPVSYSISFYSSMIGGAVGFENHWGFYGYTKITNWKTSEFILFADSLPTGVATPLSGAAYSFYINRATSFANMQKCLAFPHGGNGGSDLYYRKGNAARLSAGFLDGHVESLTAEEFIALHMTPDNGARTKITPLANNIGNVSVALP